MSSVDTTIPTVAGTIWDELVGELPAGVLLCDERGAVLAANSRAADLLCLRAADLLDGARPVNWAPLDASGGPLVPLPVLVRQVLQAGTPLTVPMEITVDGVSRTRLLAEIRPLPHRGDGCALVVLSAVESTVVASAGLLDPVTGLPGRELLLDRLDQALVRARTHGTRTSLVLSDLTGDASEQLIVGVAQRLRTGLREDHTVARFAGGTFAVVADHPRGTGAPIADRVHRLAEQPVRSDEPAEAVTVRCTWATSDGDCTVHDFLCRAEAGLSG